MRRSLPTFAVALSLVLSVTTAALWLHSIFYTGGVAVWRGVRTLHARSDMGYIRLSYTYAYRPVTGRDGVGGYPYAHRRSYNGHRAPGFLGFSASSDDMVEIDGSSQPVEHVWAVTFPHAFLVALFAFPPLRRAAAARRRRRAQGLCPTCSYDLRATPDRCPECGFQPGAAPLTASTPHPETHTPPAFPPP